MHFPLKMFTIFMILIIIGVSMAEYHILQQVFSLSFPTIPHFRYLTSITLCYINTFSLLSIIHVQSYFCKCFGSTAKEFIYGPRIRFEYLVCRLLSMIFPSR